MCRADQLAKERKIKIQLAAQRSANRYQNEDYVCNKDYVWRAIHSRNRYKDMSSPLMPGARSAAQRSANRRKNNQYTYTNRSNDLYTLTDLSIYLYCV